MVDVNVGVTGERDGVQDWPPGCGRRSRGTLPDADPTGIVFLGFATRHDLERHLGPMWGKVAALLTGLTEDELTRLGGARFIRMPEGREFARFLDPARRP